MPMTGLNQLTRAALSMNNPKGPNALRGTQTGQLAENLVFLEPKQSNMVLPASERNLELQKAG